MQCPSIGALLGKEGPTSVIQSLPSGAVVHAVLMSDVMISDVRAA